MRYPDFLKNGDTIGLILNHTAQPLTMHRRFSDRKVIPFCAEKPPMRGTESASAQLPKNAEKNLPGCTALRSVMRFSPAEAGN